MTTPILRPYQAKAEGEVFDAWRQNARNVMLVAPTGAGKTVILSSIIMKMQRPTVAIAHRQELVSQMSLALARNGVRHRIIGQAPLIRMCVSLHIAETGVSYYDAMMPVAVAGVDTLIRLPPTDAIFQRAQLWIVDECHHLAGGNKWHKAVEMFPHAYGLGVTATPLRADGKGLGRHHDGVMDVMVVAPSMRQLINDGYLCDYRLFAPPNDLDLRNVTTTASGDFSPEPLRQAVHRSHIHGDIVAHYMRIAAGKIGITFAVDVESAVELANAYRQQGIPAEAISAKTPDNIRYKLLHKLATGEIKQLVNVDLFGEGFDLPAIDVCSMGRPTQSYGLFVQQFGRALRLRDGKDKAIIIDHVGNALRHGLPDAEREWSLDRVERRARNTSDEQVVPVRSCPQCSGVYERSRLLCPYCGHRPEPIGRSSPEQVDGDLSELTPETLARMRGEIAANLQLRIPEGATPVIVASLQKHHRDRVAAQNALKAAMALWGGIRTHAGMDIREAQREFYLRFGIDVATAQTLNARESLELLRRIGISE